MEGKQINWAQIIVTALITGLITIVAGMILFSLQTKKPKLTYEVPETSPFQGTGQNFAIYNVTISNSGGTTISNVVGVIQVPNSSLDDLKVTAASSLKYTTNIAGETLTLRIPDLNPTETIALSILVSSQSELPNNPDVSVRGTGITGQKALLSGSDSILRNGTWLSIVAAVAALASGFSAFSLLLGDSSSSSISIAGITLPIPMGGLTVFSGKHHEDQEKVMAYLCGLHNLLDDMDMYLKRQAHAFYWAEADRFAALAMVSPESEAAENRKKVLINLLQYARMTSLSEALIHFNIAKIAFAQNNAEEAKIHLKEAKKVGGKLIETRLKLEPSLSLLLENHMNAKNRAA